MTIQMREVESSNIHSIGYDKATQTLAIRFKGGKSTYHYAGVPQEVADGFNKGSAGQHFFKAVKGKFQHTIIEDKEP